MWKLNKYPARPWTPVTDIILSLCLRDERINDSLEAIACCMNRSVAEVNEHIKQRSGLGREIIGLDYEDLAWHMCLCTEENRDMRQGKWHGEERKK